MELVITVDADPNTGAKIVRLGATRITYPLLAQIMTCVRGEVEGGALFVAIDFATVTYIDSATIGCVMDLHRLLEEKGGRLHVVSPQARVETMLSMAGVHKIVPIFRDEEEGLAAFARPEAGR